MKKIVITSGYFNPLHIGHINLFKAAKSLGDFLVVIVNNDEQVKLKGSTPFMPEGERLELIRSLKYVDEAILSVDKDRTVIKSIDSIAQKYINESLVFSKGGDSTMENVPELEICKKRGIEFVLGVGGNKVQSSSWLINKASDLKKGKS